MSCTSNTRPDRGRIGFSAWHGQNISSRYLHGASTSDIITRTRVSRTCGNIIFIYEYCCDCDSFIVFYIYYDYGRIVIESSTHQLLFITTSSRPMDTSSTSYSSLPSGSIKNSTTTATSRSTSTMTTNASSSFATTAVKHSGYSSMVSHHGRMQPFPSTANNPRLTFDAVITGQEKKATPSTRLQQSISTATVV